MLRKLDMERFILGYDGCLTSLEEIGLSNKKLVKVVDMLGRETSISSNKVCSLFMKMVRLRKVILVIESSV